MKIIISLIAIALFLVFSVQSVSALELLDDQSEISKSGDPGEEVIHHYFVKNDNTYSVDIRAEISDGNWNAHIKQDEYFDVPANHIVEFEILVRIPFHPTESNTTTLMDFYERENIVIVSEISKSEYRLAGDDEIYTTIEEIHDKNSFSQKITEESPSYIRVFIISILFTYIWYGRKFFFLSSLYTNIPKDKLLDNKNRGKISAYLSDNNGSNLSEISQGTGIHLQTLRHYMKLFEQSNLVLKKDKRFYIRNSGSDIFDTDILSPVLQRVFEIIKESDGITISDLIETTNRSKPWIGNRLHDLLTLDIIEIRTVGRFKYIYPKGSGPQYKLAQNS